MDTLAALCADYFDESMAYDPVAASFYGIPGHDAELPDPRRAADGHRIAKLDDVRTRLAAITPETEADRITHAVLERTVRDQQTALAHALGDVAVSPSIGGVVTEVVGILPSVRLTDAARSEDYLSRLGKLGDYLDGYADRYRLAVSEGRTPTARGVTAAVAQIDALLAGAPGASPFLRPDLPSDVDSAAWRSRGEDLVRTVIHPALARLRDCYAEELAPHARDDAHAGLCHLPGGNDGYAAAAAASTTTMHSAEEIHRIGLDCFEALRAEFAELGGRALGVSDVDGVIAALREDTSLRFEDSAEIVATVTGALNRATEALPDWLRADDLALLHPCDIGEMPESVAEGGPLAYYLPPASDGSRPGRHEVNALHPHLRPRYEYETLAFHESVPGHHVQVAIGQALPDIPAFRRFAGFTAHIEGWGLYTERLAEEMDLYSSDVHRLGMVSFDAWRAARLVVDTGIHAFGWSREQGIDFMRHNTALSEVNIANEVDRYIAMPGQALAYMIGRRTITELRADAQRRLGNRFDIKEFHHLILGNGALPLDVLSGIVERWA